MAGRNKKPRVDEIEEELDASEPRQRRPRFPATEKNLAHRVKTASQLPDAEFLAKRRENPYVIERAHLMPHIRGKDIRFHTAFQAQIYKEILMRKSKDNVAKQHFIVIGHMEQKPEYFGEALAICDDLGLRPILELQQDYDEGLVSEFLATVHLANETVRRLIWMSKGEQFELQWSEVGELIGYPDHGPFVGTTEYDAGWFRVHTSQKSKPKDELVPLYFWKKYAIGFAKGLYPTYDILNRIFRETINPKVGNIDEIQGYLKDLLLLVHKKRVTGITQKLDVMDYIWQEIWSAIVWKRNACYGPLIMKIILFAWEQRHPGIPIGDADSWVTHKGKRLLVKNHEEPTIHSTPAARKGKAKPKIIIDEEAGPSQPKPSGDAFKWMARALKKVFCVSKKIEKDQWSELYGKEQARRDDEQAEILRRRDEGEDFDSIHYESPIPTWAQWQAKDSEGQLITWSDYEEAEEEGISKSYPLEIFLKISYDRPPKRTVCFVEIVVFA